MQILALETATERLSLALLRDGRSWVRDIDAGQNHSDLAVPAIAALFAEAGTTLAACDAIAFGQGPGSFTGVRIACGLAQGLSLGIGKPVLPVTTLLALAEPINAPRVIVAQDARMNEIYFGAWQRDDAADSGWREEIAPMLVAPAGLPALAGDDWQGVGSAFAVPALKEALIARYVLQLRGTTRGTWPSALAIATIAARRIERAGIGVALPPEQAAPLYLRNKVALTIAERDEARAQKAAMKAVA